MGPQKTVEVWGLFPWRHSSRTDHSESSIRAGTRTSILLLRSQTDHQLEGGRAWLDTGWKVSCFSPRWPWGEVLKNEKDTGTQLPGIWSVWNAGPRASLDMQPESWDAPLLLGHMGTYSKGVRAPECDSCHQYSKKSTEWGLRSVRETAPVPYCTCDDGLE